PASSSALLNFSRAAIIDALDTKFPIGALPGFQSVAIAKIAPRSNKARAGVKLQPKPKDAAGNATATVSDSANFPISVIPDTSKWSAERASNSTAKEEPDVVN